MSENQDIIKQDSVCFVLDAFNRILSLASHPRTTPYLTHFCPSLAQASVRIKSDSNIAQAELKLLKRALFAD